MQNKVIGAIVGAVLAVVLSFGAGFYVADSGSNVEKAIDATSGGAPTCVVVTASEAVESEEAGAQLASLYENSAPMTDFAYKVVQVTSPTGDLVWVLFVAGEFCA